MAFGFQRDRPGRKFGGVCIYVRHSPQVALAPNFSHPSLEMLWLRIRLKQQTLYVGCLYRPPNENGQFWPNLENFLQGLEGKEIVLMDDLNVNVLSTSRSDVNLLHLKETCAPLQLNKLVNAPTRLSATSQKCIDIILSNSPLLFSAVKHVDFSDHALVYSTLQLRAPLEPRLSISRRLTHATGSLLRDALLRHKVNHFSVQDINSMWKEWTGKFLASLDEVAPTSALMQGSKKRRCPRMTPQLLHLIHK